MNGTVVMLRSQYCTCCTGQCRGMKVQSRLPLTVFNVHVYRFGSFEIFKTRDQVTGRVGPSVGRMDILHQLLDYVTQLFYPEVRHISTDAVKINVPAIYFVQQIHSTHSEDRVARTAAFFKKVCLKTARLVALWQCVGFCHG